MAYVAHADFRLGLQRKRPRVAAETGSLWDLKNAHITRGGDIERAKKFVPEYTLPAGTTFGLLSIAGSLYVFGSANDPGSIPLGVTYQQLAAENGAAMTAVLDAKAYLGSPYVVAQYDDGNIRHFYNGARVTDWDSISDANSSASTLAAALAAMMQTNSDVIAQATGASIQLTGVTPGAAFTVVATGYDASGFGDQIMTVTTPQPASAAVAGVAASGSVTITGGAWNPTFDGVGQITVNGVGLLVSPIDWILSNDATAAAIVAAINKNSSVSGYWAESSGPTVTIKANSTGSTPNGYAVAVTTLGTTTATSANLSGGVDAAAAKAQISVITLSGTYDSIDRYFITINGVLYSITGRASGAGTFTLVYRGRVYSLANTHFKYSKLNDPTNWTDSAASSGAGFINMASQSEGSERLVAANPYAGYVAIFSSRTIRIYDIESDATTNALFQTLDNTGTISARSVAGYGNTDVFYLDTTGIRSIRARDASNAAYVNDLGSPVDKHVQEWNRTAGAAAVANAVAAIEPTDNRYMLAIGGRIYVFSYFPSAQVAAWSYYEPGFNVSAFARDKSRLYARAVDTVYVYGGMDGTTYPGDDETPVTIKLPFFSAQTPATFKEWTSYDIACKGEWSMKMLVDSKDESQTVNGGTIIDTTYAGPAQELVGRAPIISAEFTCRKGGEATFSSFIVHYDAEEAN